MGKRIFAIILAATLVILSLSACNTMTTPPKKTAVDPEYADNTEILRNPNAPVNAAVLINDIEGYTEKSIPKTKFPRKIADTHLYVDSVGAYTGAYVEDMSMTECKDVFACVIRNDSDQLLSYSSFNIIYGDDESVKCGFHATNIKPHCSALVLSDDKNVKFDVVLYFQPNEPMEVLSDGLTMLDGSVGVSYKDGMLVVTNLTENDLGTVYIRYKMFTGGNVYLGGFTGSIMVENVKAFETYHVDAGVFNPDTCEIVCVENDTSAAAI